MILATWFLENCQDKQDLENWQMLGQLTPDDYKELKTAAQKFLTKKFFIMAKKGNKEMANYFYATYKEVMKRVNEIEGIKNA